MKAGGSDIAAATLERWADFFSTFPDPLFRGKARRLEDLAYRNGVENVASFHRLVKESLMRELKLTKYEVKKILRSGFDDPEGIALIKRTRLFTAQVLGVSVPGGLKNGLDSFPLKKLSYAEWIATNPPNYPEIFEGIATFRLSTVMKKDQQGDDGFFFTLDPFDGAKILRLRQKVKTRVHMISESKPAHSVSFCDSDYGITFWLLK